MSQPEAYDVLVLGSGEGGKCIAWHLAAEGKRVAMIERRYIGGSCPNIACLPSKNVIHSAKVASYFQRSGEFGISASGWKLDMAGVRARKRAMVEGLVQMHLDRYAKTGVDLMIGHGHFVAPKTLEVTLGDGGVRTLRGEHLVLSTGSRASIEDVPGLRACAPLTHVEALELDTVPGHLLVLGGGYVGLEFAQAMRRFGSRVTIIERNASLVHREDPDVIEALHALCRDEGIEICAGATLRRVEGKSGDAVEAYVTQRGAEIVLRGTHLLAAGGRTPNTDGIGLDVAGVELNAQGHIKVNARLETTAPGVWAMGDCAGSPYFTHVAFDDFRIVRDNMAGGNHVTTGRQVPFSLFTDPELARVGLSEREAKAQGIGYRLGKLPMKMVLRTRTLSEERGFLKALVAADSDRMLGFTALGVDAGELLPAVQIVMSAGLPYTLLRDAVITHPTLAEGFGPLLSTVPARPTT
jgi:pyruvate/2-oxoglutarate dehydrogenase complex dihydrolipoamide dehydrogenase (E3) component